MTFSRIERDGLAWLRHDAWPALRHGIFTRHGGTSPAPFAALNLGGNVGDSPAAVRANHERMYAALGVSDARACTVWQVHSADIVFAHTPAHGRRWLAHADGLITDQPDLPLSMRFADCTPILLYDPRQGVIGIAHAGWRGTVQGIAGKMVHAMAAAFGSRPADVQAAVGPCIGPAAYQVGPEVLAAARAHFGTLDGLTTTRPDGTHTFDLWAANRLDLERAGAGQVAVAAICTAETTHDWFSHRAEHGRTGRFGAVIAL
jgi:YfiH family protein